ncbi:MAG: hypothetical protein FWG39_01880 [Alphaproteobacteria bacterium]|nr:hypothetical protein [Alphaproteobacteria bacterium]
MNYNQFHYDRSIKAIGATGAAQSVNYETANLKVWFIHQMRNSFYMLMNETVGGKPLFPEYRSQFKDGDEDIMPNPNMTSWRQLFAIYQVFHAQATGHIKGLAVPAITDLMDRVVEESNWRDEFDAWYQLPLDYLNNTGGLQIRKIDRSAGKSDVKFAVRNKQNPHHLGYLELFSIPKFGEFYCETNNAESLQTTDRLIAVTDAHDTRYYSIMMCKKLPAQIFGRYNR